VSVSIVLDELEVNDDEVALGVAGTDESSLCTTEIRLVARA
jgi:hypothetical protein